MNLAFKNKFGIASLMILPLTPLLALAQTDANLSERLAKIEAANTAAQSSADNAWVLLCSALVLLMTAPGLALFYGGLVRQEKRAFDDLAELHNGWCGDDYLGNLRLQFGVWGWLAVLSVICNSHS